MAASRVPPLAPLRLLLLLLPLLWLLVAAPAASQSNHDHDEEELQIVGRDLWHTRGGDVASGHDDASGEQQPPTTRSRTRKRENELLDPFAFTFEDYLREASGASAATSGNQRRIDESDNLIASDEQLSRPPGGQLIVEDDDQAGSVSSSRADGHARQHPHVNSDLIGSGGGGGGDSSAEHNNEIIRPGEPDEATSASNKEDAELRLHFAWVSLATQRCSRVCGRGRRLVHSSCLDLKYNVRVSDELCQAARLSRPSELSDEPCNELDCPPEWTTVEFQHCQPSGADSPSGQCKAKLFKRLECTMLARDGQTVHLDESRCADDQRPALPPPQPEVATSSERNTSADEEISIDLNEQLDKERNEILLNETPVDEYLRHKATGRRHGPLHGKHLARPNEPFFEPGEWSECLGAPCGALGKRTRQLACRLYLARSAKFVELPESSCLASGATVQLEREEPCYLDCGPQETIMPNGLNRNSTHYQVDQYQDDQELTIETLPAARNQAQRHEYKLSALGEVGEVVKEQEQEEEEILDPAAARYVWRHAHDWTKCSAECLGGVSESLIECWDRVANSSVEERHCDALHRARPGPLRRACNEGPCAPEWRLSPFTQCSRACGSAGSRSRSLACVQQVARALPAHQSTNYMLVSNDLCFEQQQLTNGSVSTPILTEACNRHHCRPEWSVGPWTECTSERTGGDECAPEAAERNRTVVCLQEFASQWGPLEGERVEASSQHPNRGVSPELREAIQLAASSWHLGKSTQVPFDECYREYHSAPAPSERCTPAACLEPELRIDADPLQDYRMLLPDGTPNPNSTQRRTVTLRVGGRAQLLEGRHVKIRCLIQARSRKHLVSGNSSSTTTTTSNSDADYHAHHDQQVEWHKDGVRIFAPNTKMADKQPLEETDNSILGGATDGELLDNELSINFEPDKYSMMAADEPESRRQQRLESRARTSAARVKTRRLSVRSGTGDGQQDFQFVARPRGRFTLVKENTLRIKRLRLDDSGIYTCSKGARLSESIELSVLSRRARHQASDLRAQHKRRMPTMITSSNHERAPASSSSSTGTTN